MRYHLVRELALVVFPSSLYPVFALLATIRWSEHHWQCWLASRAGCVDDSASPQQPTSL